MEYILTLYALTVNQEIETVGKAPAPFKNLSDCMEYAFQIYKSSEFAYDYNKEEDRTVILYPDGSVLIATCEKNDGF